MNEEQADRAARIKAQAMRDHAFVGEGPYCEARISFRPMGGQDTGTITGWSGCGYPPDMHHERVVTTPTGWIVNSGALKAYDDAYRIHGARDDAMRALWEQACREDWARDQVKKAGQSWRTHMVKFGGAVVPRW